ncbi:MAG: S8 family serine peptidase, partial [Candidatus Zixiibacteriota bacterium]
MRNQSLSPIPFLTFFCLVTFAATSNLAKEKPSFLVPQPVVINKTPQALSAGARAFLTEDEADSVKVWVFFTDKGVSTKQQFERAARSVSLSRKVLSRRAKTGADRVLFVDLPVVQDYVDHITGLGAQHRRTSKWLNAASFTVPVELLDEIGRLPFVYEIQPVAGFKTERSLVESLRIETPVRQSLAPDVLSYGNAQEQLEQINVPPVHNQGYHGEGVTLAIFDTGFRKSHEAFAAHYAEGRVLAEWDFVFNDGNTANEAEDWSSQWDHGTLIWSTTGGHMDGVQVGPAYKANFILAKTEDIRSETPVEEDNWVAALEWVDSLGADVVTSSLAYSDWYTYEDFDGNTATITLAANTAAGLGIVVCNAMANSGPAAGTLHAPADAFDILAVGAVDASGTIASFSSRGPTYDGRTKPEVCARGVSTACATASSDNSYGTASGTSLSTPLVAGAACLVIQARPEFTPQMIRLSLMETADRAANPDNTYGWGIINTDAALGWGVNFYADTPFGHAPMTVQFYDSSTLAHSSWVWAFGDGDSAYIQYPPHYYAQAGAYDVSLTINTQYGDITRTRSNYIILLGDTVTFRTDSAFAGQQAVMSVDLVNSQELREIIIPFKYESTTSLGMGFDSVKLGSRTAYFESLSFVTWDPANRKYTVKLTADVGGGAPPLAAGSGEVLKIYFTLDPYAFGGNANDVDTTYGTRKLELTAPEFTYEPVFHAGEIRSI